jgi:predicted DNA-binding ribbon-helix-helix protein
MPRFRAPRERRITLTFDPFGWETLEAAAQAADVSVDELVSRAAAYFESDLGAERVGIDLPREHRDRLGRTAHSLRLRLDRAAWDALEGEAQRQGVELERLLEHAALYYVTDLDAGRVTG